MSNIIDFKEGKASQVLNNMYSTPIYLGNFQIVLYENIDKDLPEDVKKRMDESDMDYNDVVSLLLSALSCLANPFDTFSEENMSSLVKKVKAKKVSMDKGLTNKKSRKKAKQKQQPKEQAKVIPIESHKDQE